VWSRKKASSPSRSSSSTESDDDSPGSNPRPQWTKRTSTGARQKPDGPRISDSALEGGTITGISLQQHGGSERVNVFLDGEYAFPLAAIISAPLRAGQQLAGAEVQALLDRDAAERAYDRALAFLAARPRSKSEVRRRLAQAGLPPAAVDAALDRLDERGYVNDEDFAAYWVAQRTTFHPRGPRALRAELRTKGIDSDTVSAAVAPVSDDQVSAACRAAERRAAKLVTTDEREFTQTISTFLVRRGFDYEAVRTAARQLWQERCTTESQV